MQKLLNHRAREMPHAPTSPAACFTAIVRQLEELKLAGPEWDGPGSVTPGHAIIYRTRGWLAGHWREEFGTPDICPTAEGGISISWEWGIIEHCIDIRPDGASLEWCRYNPQTLQSAETELPMNRQGWDAIAAALTEPGSL